MNELFAGYASYASTEAVLAESFTAGNSPDDQSGISLSVTVTVTISWTYSWTW